MPNANDNEHLLRQFLAAVWNAGDIDASDRFIAPAYTIHHDPGDPWNARTLDLAGYKERVRLSRAPFPDQAFDIQDILAEQDKVMITWLWSGTHKADYPGFPATGNVITMSGATVYYIHDGRLTGHWQITDRLGVFLQLRQAAGNQKAPN